jgi:hypothetical protein
MFCLVITTDTSAGMTTEANTLRRASKRSPTRVRRTPLLPKGKRCFNGRGSGSAFAELNACTPASFVAVEWRDGAVRAEAEIVGFGTSEPATPSPSCSALRQGRDTAIANLANVSQKAASL